MSLHNPINKAENRSPTIANQMENSPVPNLQDTSAAALLRYQAFQQRISKIKALNHPTIAPIAQAGITAEKRYYVQLVEADHTTLAEKLANYRESEKTFEATKALELIIQLTEALSVLHELGIIHYDLQPDNILFDNNSLPQLAGFSQDSPKASLPSNHDLLDPGYHAPESVFEACVDAQSNIYSLGILLHELLTGYRPQQLIGDSVINNQTGNTLRVACPELATTTFTLIDNCLAEQPHNRYENMWELQQALHEALYMEKRLAKRRTTPGLWDIIVLGTQQFGREIILTGLAIVALIIVAVTTVNLPELGSIEKVSYFVNTNLGLIPILLLITLLVAKELVHVPDGGASAMGRVETILNKLIVPAIMMTGFLVIVQIAQMVVNITVE